MEKFRSFSITHEGAKHEAGAPCQDASDYNDELENAVIAVVADGHGSSRCFRSDIGSAKAVEAAKKNVEHFIQDNAETVISPEGFRAELHGIVKQIINKWFAAVMKDEEANPLQNDPRLEGVTQKYKDRYINDIDYRCHAYGTTLTVAVMSKSYWFGFQVGDGKCVVLYEDGSWKLPIPWDDRCTFNTTTSICDDDSLSGFRYWFGIGDDKGGYTEYGYGVEGQGKDYGPNPIKTMARPLAIFIASDGVEDSYPRVDNDKYVINFYRNRIITFAKKGFESFKEEIDGFAKRFADRESTDDVSIAVIAGDIAGKSAMIERMKRESERHEAVELAVVKRRDADEKKDALAAVESRANAITANQKQFESKIANIEQELGGLETKRKSIESALAKGEPEAAASGRDMIDAQNNVRGLEGERYDSLSEEKMIAVKISRVDGEALKAQKNLKRAENDCASRQKSFRKEKEDYDKYLAKLSLSQITAPAAVSRTPQIVVTQISYSVIPPGFNEPNPVPQTAAPVSTPSTVVLPDAKLKELQHKVNIRSDALKTSEEQVTAARQHIETKHKEITELKRQLFDTQQNSRRIEFDIDRIKRDYQRIEARDRDNRAAARQRQNEMTDIDRQINVKQAELGKLKIEFETLKTQTKKQTDTLAVIREAWEKAETEAADTEAAILKNKQDGTE